MTRTTRTLIDVIRTSGEGRLRPMVPESLEASPPTPMSLRDELNLLEKEARERGMPHDELNTTRQIGDCPAQVETRIERLHTWLAAH